MTEPDYEADGPGWEWVNYYTGEPSRAIERSIADRLEAALPQPSTVELRALEARLGRDRLVAELTGRTAMKPPGSSKIVGDKTAWTRARKWLSDHIGSGRRAKINEPYRSRLAKLIVPGAIRVSMQIHAKVSNKDKLLSIRDLDLAGPNKDSYLSGSRERDPGKSIFTVLSVWGNGMENRVTRVYDVNNVRVNPR